MKIPDIETLKNKDPGILEFIDFVQIILNDGRYEMRVIASVPDWTANEGEFLCYAAGNLRRLYAYINSQWIYMGFNSNGYNIINGSTDSYWYYNSVTGYLECWIEGAKRMEM